MGGVEVSGSQSIRVTLLYFAALRDIAGKRQEELTLPNGATLKDALRELKRKYGEGFSEPIAEGAGRRSAFQILLDGERVPLPHGVNLKLKGGSTIAFVPPIAGG